MEIHLLCLPPFAMSTYDFAFTVFLVFIRYRCRVMVDYGFIMSCLITHSILFLTNGLSRKKIAPILDWGDWKISVLIITD